MSGDVAAEIVIIKKKKGGEEGHHSTAWKIAYADFMTAMMALFLVLWLVGAASEKAKKQIASYFNPLELSAPIPKPKGVVESTETIIPDETDTEGDKPKPPAFEGDAGEPMDKSAEAAPQGAKLAPVSADDAPGSAHGPGPKGMPNRSHTAGQAMRDPFSPDFRSTAPPAVVFDPERPAQAAEIDQPPDASEVPPVSPRVDAAQRERTERAAEEIAAELRKVAAGAGPGIEVSVEPEGVLISLTDTASFGMFDSASSDPTAATLKLLSDVSSILSQRKGRVRIRGHTDARPFRATDNDNWRLSMSRAYSAYRQLVSAGFDESRVERIEGFADRKLRTQEAPFDASNRRIEILLRLEG